jgi:hypothetical protein
MSLTIKNYQFPLEQSKKGLKIRHKVGFWFHPKQSCWFSVKYEGQKHRLKAVIENNDVVLLECPNFMITFRYAPDQQTIVPMYLIDKMTPW